MLTPDGLCPIIDCFPRVQYPNPIEGGSHETVRSVQVERKGRPRDGRGRGIGKFIATGLAEAGADLILTSRKMKNLEAAINLLTMNLAVKGLAVFLASDASAYMTGQILVNDGGLLAKWLDF